MLNTIDSIEREINQQRAKRQVGLITCPCGCTFLEQITVAQYKVEQPVLLTQHAISASDNFVLLRCIKCGKISEPPLMKNYQNEAAKTYDSLLDQIEGK